MLAAETLVDGTPLKNCQPRQVGKVLVSRFALEFPEQMPAGEMFSVGNVSAVETAKMITRLGRVLADFDDAVFPYVSPARAPDPQVDADARETPFTRMARERRAQYVLSGVYRDFGIRSVGLIWKQRARRMEVEAFIHDGGNGTLLARKAFAREVVGEVLFGTRYAVGTPAFYGSEPGRTWGLLLEDIARWATDEAACLPFLARVIKVDGAQIHIDAGTESRLTVGDAMVLHSLHGQPVRTQGGTPLDQEKAMQSIVILRAVYPKFSVGELLDAVKGLPVRQGDLVYPQQ